MRENGILLFFTYPFDKEVTKMKKFTKEQIEETNNRIEEQLNVIDNLSPNLPIVVGTLRRKAFDYEKSTTKGEVWLRESFLRDAERLIELQDEMDIVRVRILETMNAEETPH